MLGRGGNAAGAVVLVAAALVTAPTPGCSYVFVTPPPPTRGAIVHCTTSDAMPVLDMVVAGVQLLRFILALSASDAAYADSTISRPPTLVIDGASTFVFAISSGYGFSQTSKCREVLAHDYDLDLKPPPRRRQPAQTSGGPPPPAQPDAGAPAPAVVVPDKPPEPVAPAAGQRVDPE